MDRIFLLVPAQAYVARMIQTLADFPARQEPATFSVDQVLAKLEGAAGGG
jgi:arylsulfatase